VKLFDKLTDKCIINFLLSSISRKIMNWT